MADVKFKKVTDVENHKLKGWTTTIRPRPPFFLFVPSFKEIPKDVREKNKDKFFALGEFFDTKEKALKKIKEAGYDKKGMMILQKQSYLKLKRLKEVL